jgi:hypothetical protein
MQNLLVHVACHPCRKHVMYARGKINLSERDQMFKKYLCFYIELSQSNSSFFLTYHDSLPAFLPTLLSHIYLASSTSLLVASGLRTIQFLLLQVWQPCIFCFALPARRASSLSFNKSRCGSFLQSDK